MGLSSLDKELVKALIREVLAPLMKEGLGGLLQRKPAAKKPAAKKPAEKKEPSDIPIGANADETK